MTKYEREQLLAKERVIRKANIKELREQLDEARNLLASIPNNGFDTFMEQRTVRAEIRKLLDFIADEERALKATYEDEATAQSIVDKLIL